MTSPEQGDQGRDRRRPARRGKRVPSHGQVESAEKFMGVGMSSGAAARMFSPPRGWIKGLAPARPGRSAHAPRTPGIGRSSCLLVALPPAPPPRAACRRRPRRDGARGSRAGRRGGLDRLRSRALQMGSRLARPTRRPPGQHPGKQGIAGDGPSRFDAQVIDQARASRGQAHRVLGTPRCGSARGWPALRGSPERLWPNSWTGWRRDSTASSPLMENWQRKPLRPMRRRPPPPWSPCRRRRRCGTRPHPGEQPGLGQPAGDQGRQGRPGTPLQIGAPHTVAPR